MVVWMIGHKFESRARKDLKGISLVATVGLAEIYSCFYHVQDLPDPSIANVWSTYLEPPKSR